jgi:hypothetical protein
MREQSCTLYELVINALTYLGFESSLIHYAECDGTRHVVEGIKFVLEILVEGEDEP